MAGINWQGDVPGWAADQIWQQQAQAWNDNRQQQQAWNSMPLGYQVGLGAAGGFGGQIGNAFAQQGGLDTLANNARTGAFNKSIAADALQSSMPLALESMRISSENQRINALLPALLGAFMKRGQGGMGGGGMPSSISTNYGSSAYYT